MINISQFNFTPDYKGIELRFDSTTTEFSEFKIAVGDAYLSDEAVDLSWKLSSGVLTYDFTGNNAITAAELLLTPDEPLSGIFIINLVNTDNTPDIKEAGILSDYKLVLCLANKTINQNQDKDLNETTFLFLLLDATKTYLSEEQYEQALSAYNRGDAICKVDKENYTEDILPCGEGTGCWIIDGVYIVKK